MALQPLLAQLRRGLVEDGAGYERLRGLLERQFQAALRHQAQQLVTLAQEIEHLVAALQAQQGQRSQTLQRLLGRRAGEGVRGLLRALPAAQREPLQQAWRQLDGQLQACKALNQRNCRLVVEQHALMQRVLGREEVLYAAP